MKSLLFNKWVSKIAITLLIVFNITGLAFSQTDTTKKKKSLLKNLAEKASGALVVKPYYWVLSLQKPVLVESNLLDFNCKDEHINIKFSFAYGAGNAGQWGPEYVCTEIINLTDDAITVNFEDMKVSNLKGDGVRNYIKIMSGSSIYAPFAKTVESGEMVQTCISSARCVRTYHHDAHYDAQGNWQEAWDQLEDFKLFCEGDVEPEIIGSSLEKVKSTMIGKEFTFYIPIVVNGETVKKSYTFKVGDVTIWQN